MMEWVRRHFKKFKAGHDQVGFVEAELRSPSEDKKASKKRSLGKKIMDFCSSLKGRKKIQALMALRDFRTFWYIRTAHAFPGLNEGCTEFSDTKEISQRLKILFKPPIGIDDAEYKSAFPIWWSRGMSDMYIKEIKILKTTDVGVFLLADIIELCISRLVFVNGGQDWNRYIYCELEAMPPSDVFDGDIEGMIERRGYAYEEYGLYKRRHITRGEYCDGAFVKNGKVINTKGKENLRYRYLSKCNILFSSSFSSLYGYPKIDLKVDELMRLSINDRDKETELFNLLLSGKKPVRRGDMV